MRDSVMSRGRSMPGILERTSDTVSESRRTSEHRYPLGRRLVDEVGDVESEKVARGDERIDRLEADVVGVDEIRPLPSERLDRRIRFLRGRSAARCGRCCAPGWICSRPARYINAERFGFHEMRPVALCPDARSGRRFPCCILEGSFFDSLLCQTVRLNRRCSK
jgi:hypothetical protein